MSVTRIHEDPRVTKPYTEGQWQSIIDLGHAVDDKLRQQDVRLSMGGEPTFISLRDQEEEWNTEAVGPTKKPLSDQFIRRIRERTCPGGMLHYGQGKWYPGELLPRWAIGLYWRKDGEPIWEDDRWIADETVDYGFTHEDAQAYTEELTRQLRIDARYIIPAYEDPVRYALKEHTCRSMCARKTPSWISRRSGKNCSRSLRMALKNRSLCPADHARQRASAKPGTAGSGCCAASISI